jgi:hypothetical protein
MELPHGLANEWRLFLDTKPSIEEVGNWCQIKAAEHGWDFFDLSMALSVGVRKPELAEPDDGGGEVN